MRVQAIFLAIFLVVTLVGAKHEEYEGFRVYKIYPETLEQIKAIKKTVNNPIGNMDFWRVPTEIRREGMVMINAEGHGHFEKFLESIEVQYEVYSDNAKTLFEQEDIVLNKANKNTERSGKALTFDTYLTYEEIDTYLTSLSLQYPNLVTVVSAGTSGEGRDIKYLRISTTNFQDQMKPVVFLDGGLDPREWIAPATALYVIDSLLLDEHVNDVLALVDFVVVPLVNPDGYEYTRTNLRAWQKNRNTNHYLGNICPGVKIDRNFEIQWQTTGASSSPCSHIYAGPESASEPETLALKNLLQEYRARISYYLTLQADGSSILYPWRHDGTLTPDGLNLHLNGLLVVNILNTYRPEGADLYTAGNAALALGYEASGTSLDYAYSIGIPNTYTIALPDFGFGFVLPPEFIIRTAAQAWEGVRYVARTLA